MLHDLVQFWFHLVRDWDYLGVFLLMALESSIVPVPSEVVMPPAAYWATQGHMDFWLVVLAGTAGSWFGSAISYWCALWIGRPLVVRFGKYVLITPHKLELAERWAAGNGLKGVFFARLLPVVRHLIGVPAGIVRMPPVSYSVMTILGSATWCAVLAWFGQAVLGEQPHLIDDPEAMVHALKAKSTTIAVGVIVLVVLYVIVVRVTGKRGDETEAA